MSRPAVIVDAGPVPELAAWLRRLYVANYKAWSRRTTGAECTWGDRPMLAWDGGIDPDTGRRRANVWLKIARCCLDDQCEPAAFMAAQFDRVEKAPFPNQCHGDKAVARYRERDADLEPRLRAAYENQAYNLRLDVSAKVDARGLSQRDAVTLVLSSSADGLSGLFRYLIAANYGFPEVAKRFRDAALIQYAPRRDAYDRTWPHIPDALRRDAEAVAGPGVPHHA